ncbi:MAG TPA: GNAT family N-acetyltransferase [Fimbriimonadaceae bacterium]|nr:GNAT family N-acetyltransferase [Fimbriimonadaceae bacterium]HRJ33255.1 GNAT family N-acetyltransferase [Fimbriimonadaceae bacterium]
MPLELRPYSSETDADLRQIWSDVYRGGQPIPADEKLHDGDWEDFQIGYQDGVAAAAFNRLQFVVTRGQADLPCSGIAAVAVKAEFRHQGLGTRLMQLAIEHSQSQGDVVSLLYPFRPSFYRRLGYEHVGERVEIAAPQHRIPPGLIELPVRRLTAEDAHLLQPCYDAFIRKIAGSPHRSPEQWIERFGEKPPLLYAVGDPVEGYFWASSKGGFWEELSVGEFVWSTERGYRNLLEVLRGLAINKTPVKWYEPSHGPFRQKFLDQGVTLTSQRLTMGRVLDVRRALSLLRTDQAGEFQVKIDDPQMPINSGVFRVCFSPDGVQVEPGSEPDFELDIRAFSQAFFGEPSLMDLARWGSVQVHRPVGLNQAERLLTPIPVYCLAFF